MGSIGHDTPSKQPVIEVDVLISGAGPTGASLACFLGSYGKDSEEMYVSAGVLMSISRNQGPNGLGCAWHCRDASCKLYEHGSIWYVVISTCESSFVEQILM